MDRPTPLRNPMALYALLINLVPFLTGLAMLGVRYDVGPTELVRWVSKFGGFFLFGTMVVGSGLTFVAALRSEQRDWRITAASLLLLAGVVEVVFFFI